MRKKYKIVQISKSIQLQPGNFSLKFLS